MHQLYGFALEGRDYVLGVADLVDIADTRNQLTAPAPAWLLPFRDRIRAATLPEVRSLLALAAQATSEPDAALPGGVVTGALSWIYGHAGDCRTAPRS